MRALIRATPSLDFSSSRLWWIVELLEFVDENLLVQYFHSQFWSLHIYLLVPTVVSILLEIVEFHRSGLQYDDGNVEVHFLAGTLPLDCECPSASCLL